MTTTATALDAFTLEDRCDRCGEQAVVRALLNAGELLFCVEHGLEHGEALAGQAVIVEESHPATAA